MALLWQRWVHLIAAAGTLILELQLVQCVVAFTAGISPHDQTSQFICRRHLLFLTILIAGIGVHHLSLALF